MFISCAHLSSGAEPPPACCMSQEALTAACTADWVVFSVITAAEALITTFFS